MDVLFFLKERTTFLRKFYADASGALREKQRRIRDEEPPYDEPPPGFNAEDAEPPYLEEWQQAEDGIDFIGQAGVSFLAVSLRLFLDEFRHEVRRTRKAPEFNYSYAKSKGALAAYELWFKDMGVNFVDSECDLAVLEQIVLTRNSVQHPSSIGLMSIQPDGTQRSKFPRPFFVHPMEEKMVEAYVSEGKDAAVHAFWMMQVSEEKLYKAIDQVERFCTWLDDRFFNRS